MSGLTKAEVLLNWRLSLERKKQFFDKSFSDAQNRYMKSCRELDKCKKEVDKIVKDESCDPTARAELLKIFSEGENLQQNFLEKRNLAEHQKADVDKKYENALQLTRRPTQADSLFLQNNESLQTLNQSIDLANKAKTVFERIKVVNEHQKEERRRFELKRMETTNLLQSAKTELIQYEIKDENGCFIGFDAFEEWSCSHELLDKAKQALKDAEEELESEHFEESQNHSHQLIQLSRELYGKALETKQQFENREIIADAIIDALNELYYDEPDVKYIPSVHQLVCRGELI